jgi:O-antigen/teichoic acid export membrane protein
MAYACRVTRADYAGVAPAPATGAGGRIRRNLAAGMAISSMAQVAVLVFSTLTSIALARLLGPGGTGRVALVLTLITILAMVFGLGLRQGIIYLVSSRRWGYADVVRDSRMAAAALGCGGALVGFGLYELTGDSLLKGLSLPMALAALAALPFAISLTFSAAIALATERWEAFGLMTVLAPAATLVLAVGLALPFETTGAIFGVAAANVLAGLVAGYLLVRRGAGPTRAGPAEERVDQPLRAALTFGSRAWVAILLQFLNYRIDLFLVNAYVSTSSAGVYSVAVTVMAIGWLLPDAIQTALFSRTAELARAAELDPKERSASDETDARGIRHTVILMLPIAALLAVLMLVAVPLLYGPEFEESVGLGLLLLPGVVILSVGKVMLTVVTGRGFPHYYMYVSLITAPVSIGLYLALIPSLDEQGAAVASSLSYLLTTLLAVVAFRRATGLALGRVLVPRRSDLTDYVHAGRQLRRRLRRA